ncbi:intraflagellar transport protein 20 [Entophlyctis helioformis]|nr:intraflagellar transport protein 20 [Entophlyctis helioformis]
MAQSTAITFDEFSKIRILDPGQFDASARLKEECKEFTQKINEFNTIVGVFQGLLAEKASQIEHEKLKTIGLRIQVESEVENRKSRQAQLQALLREREAELDRLAVQHESLVKVQTEQQAFMDALTMK